MSCNGCRVLRKGCSENCILRPCLQWIHSGDAQAHATVFLARFFGRAALISFISAVPQTQRPALFRSLLFEAAGRTVNPVTGAVGLLWTGDWRVCRAAVETVLRGGALKPIPELLLGGAPAPDDASGCSNVFKLLQKRRRLPDEATEVMQLTDLDLSLTPGFNGKIDGVSPDKRRPGSPSMNSEESVTTTCGDRSVNGVTLLSLFN